MPVGTDGRDLGQIGDDHVQRKAMASKLMIRGQLEAVDELENSLLQAFTGLQPMLTPPYHLSSQSPAQHANLPQALLYAILTHPASAVSYAAQLTAITHDGYASVVSTLSRLVNESYPKLLDQPRSQIIWLLRQLISFSAADVDSLCLCLLRQVAGGDLRERNLTLARDLLDIMRSNWVWFNSSIVLLTTAVYTYLRLLPDHAMAKSAAASELKQKETAFCIQILRERFQDCKIIGRDLVRLLQDVALIPEFEPLWRDLLSNPSVFGLEDISKLYEIRTPTRYITSRITPEMETQIRFMLNSVKMGYQRRYQTWFAHKYLSSPESETLVCDLIRFICAVIHPSNQILQSDIVPRWAIIGWLLKCCKNNHLEANARFALFYDWLFFGKRHDNIMNIEPAILLMTHSIPKYVDMTHSLLDFLFLLIEHYDPPRKALIQQGVTSSIGILIEKGVVRSLEPLLTACNSVASPLRDKLMFYFPAYCKVEPIRTDLRPEHVPMSNALPSVQTVSGSRGSQAQSGVVRTAELTDAEAMRMEDVKPNDHGVAETASRKRKRPPDSEGLWAEMPLNFKKLTDAFDISNEVAVSALEKLVLSFTSASDQLVTGRFAGQNINDTVTGNDGSLSPVNHILDSALGNLAKFAHEVTEILKKGGYDIFGPLKKVPSNILETDETNSLTSTLLRLYVANRHPQVRNLLVFWHREGHSVGARLLCYVSRLAEELEQSASASLGFSHMQDADNSKPVRSDDDSVDTSSTGEEGDEEGELTEGNSDSRRQKAVSNQLSGQVQVESVNRKTASRDLQATEMHMRCRTAVADAFSAYEEFVRHSTKDLSSTQNEALTASSQGLQNHRSGVAARSEAQVTDPSVGLLSDLQTCLVWNTYRYLRVLPSVFRYLPHLATGKDELVEELVAVLDPLELCNFEFRLSLGEFQILGLAEGLDRLIRKSLKWEFLEQQFFWRLLAAEALAAQSRMTLQVLRTCVVCVQPSVNAQAMGGLMCLLRGQPPTPLLVNTVLSLPHLFGKFAAVVLTNWISSHYKLLRSCLRSLNSGSLALKDRPKKSDDSEEDAVAGRYHSSVVIGLLNSLKDLENGRSNGEENGVREIRRAILQLAGSRGSGNLSPGPGDAMGSPDS